MLYRAIALLLATSAAGAANWQQVGTIDATEGVVFVDVANVAEVKGYRRAWLKSVHTADQPIPPEYHSALGSVRKYRWMRSVSVLSCSKRVRADVDLEWFGADELKVGQFRHESLNFRPVVPGTLDEQALQAVCAADLVEPLPPLEEQAKMTSAASPRAYYPRESANRREQGSPVIRVCVDPQGKLLREPEVAESSGFPELDAAGIAVAKDSRYLAGSRNGAALPESCTQFAVTFQLLSPKSKEGRQGPGYRKRDL
jgi:TonB family protein